MKYFRALYNFIRRRNDILVEAYESGLEFRLGEFFYNPESRNYDQELRERWLNEVEHHLQELLKISGSDDECDDKKRYTREGLLAVTVYMLFHPIKVQKAKVLAKDGITFF